MARDVEAGEVVARRVMARQEPLSPDWAGAEDLLTY
jgi:hypothetical protein